MQGALRRGRGFGAVGAPVLSGCLAALLASPAAWGAPPSLLPRVAPMQAQATSGPRVAIVVVGLDPTASQLATGLEQAAETALRASGRFEVVPAQDAANPTAARARVALLEKAAAKVAEGTKALEDLDEAQAEVSFGEAVDALLGADSSRDMQPLLDAWLWRARAHATARDVPATKKDIEALVRLEPKLELSSEYFGADLIRFAATHAEQAEAAGADITLSTEPPGARVWVDGHYRGLSPVTVAGVTPGPHFVAAARQGYALAQAQLSSGAHTLTLEPGELAGDFKRAAAVVAADPEGPGRDEGVKALGRALGVDQVLAVVAKKSVAGEQLEVTALRLEVRDGHNAAFAQGLLRVGDDTAYGDFLARLCAKDDPRDGSAPRTHFKRTGPGAKTKVGIALMAVGVAAAATGTVFGVMALNDSRQLSQTPQVQVVKSQQLMSEGRTWAWVADGAFIAAGVTALTGLVLTLTDRGDQASSSPGVKKSSRGLDPRRVEEDRRRAQELERRDAARREEERRREAEARERRAAEKPLAPKEEEPAKAAPAPSKGKEDEAPAPAESKPAEQPPEVRGEEAVEKPARPKKPKPEKKPKRPKADEEDLRDF